MSMTMTFARLLSPKSLHWVRSVKRAIMAEPPLPPMTTDFVPPPKDTVVQGRVPVREQPPASPTLQAVALKRYAAHQISAPYLFFDTYDILILAAKDLASFFLLIVLSPSSTLVHYTAPLCG